MSRIDSIRTLWRAAIVAALLGPGVALGDGDPTEGNAEVRVRYSENYCLGGIEDRKIIVDESQITNPFHETSRLGCQVDGGQPQTMPDLPTPTPEQQRLA